jgi:uncharacterized protein
MKQSILSLRQALALLVVLCLTWAQATKAQQPEGASSLLWKITGNGLKKPSYLYGTYHLVPSGYLPADGKVMAAFQSAKGVIVEIEMDSATMMRTSMMAIMPQNKLSQLLDSADYALVDQEFKANTGYGLQPFEQVKPIALTLMLTLAYNTQVAPWIATHKGAALDMYFQQEGKRLGKNILALETVEAQMKILYDSETVQEQAKDLLEIVRDRENMLKASEEVSEGWRTEDLDRMAAAANGMMDSYGSSEVLLGDRNARWMDILPKAMKKGTQFIAVGALHLTGDDGLIQLLRGNGYTLTPVPGK